VRKVGCIFFKGMTYGTIIGGNTQAIGAGRVKKSLNLGLRVMEEYSQVVIVWRGF
jgi:hypothetical protein